MALEDDIEMVRLGPEDTLVLVTKDIEAERLDLLVDELGEHLGGQKILIVNAEEFDVKVVPGE